MVAYVAIGKKAGVSSQTIRKAYATFTHFTQAEREENHLVPYVVFNHARRCENPEAVLKYYTDEMSKGTGISIDEIYTAFPLSDEEEKEIASSKYPRWSYGVVRQIGQCARRDEAQSKFDELIEILKEVEK